MARSPLIIEADRLLHLKGRVALDYLSVLLQIRRTPSIWRKQYGSFKQFCKDTGHGPEAHVLIYEEAQALLSRFDTELIKRGSLRTPTTLEAIGFGAAKQLLKLAEQEQPKVIEALYQAARGTGHVLTYQAATNILYEVLGWTKKPSKIVRGKKLKGLREDLKRLQQLCLDLHQLVAWLRQRVRRQAAHIQHLTKRLDEAGIDHAKPDHPLGDEDLVAAFEAQRQAGSARSTPDPDGD